ncbi:MAG: OsmC family protein [Candidatus Accumulibacter phosphatis]|nr:OsmC family protein [Candidatus Accumulibacter phosphatis]
MHYVANLVWERGDQNFESGTFSRRHRIAFDGGQTFVASSSPQVLPTPMSDEFGIDPEEAFVASLASCHMLWFFVIASKRKYCVDRYVDNACGVMRRNDDNRIAVTEVLLRPKVTFSGPRLPTEDEHRAMHHRAHELCFIANSVKTAIECQPELELAPTADAPD